jgi:hypothetical protein
VFDFLEALVGSDVEDLGHFFTPSAVIGDRYGVSGASGLDEIRWDWLGHNFRQGMRFEQVFLARDRITVVDGFPGRLGGSRLRAFEISGGLIAHESVGMPAEEMRIWAARDRLQALYASYIAAWEADDETAIADVYEPGAARTDGLLGGTRLIGEDWEGAGPRFEMLVGDDSHYELVQASAVVMEETPAIFAVGSGLAAADAAQALAMFDVGGSDCELRLLAVWELEDFLVVGEEILYEVSSLRRCASSHGMDLPEGWWTGWKAPDLFPESVTGEVSTHDGTVIDIVNGSARQIELVEWGLGRFELAGLAAPRPAAVAFPPTQLCVEGAGDHPGYTTFHQTEARIELCRHERDICVDRTCGTFHSDARFGVLHELGHIWEYQNLNDTTREEFLARQGREVWSDGELTWGEDEGIELAVEIIAWGLMDQTELDRILDVNPEDLNAEFRLLTGAEPLTADGSSQPRPAP